jgi:hypothetical protein
MDDIIEILKSIIDEKNPEKVVDLTMDLDDYVGGYGSFGRYFQFSTNDLEHQEDFHYGLKEYRRKKEYLIEKEVLEFYNYLFEILTDKTEKELISFYNEHSKDDRNVWLGFKLNIDLNKKELIELKFYKLNEPPIVIEDSDKRFGHSSKEIERFSLVGDNQIKVEIAVNNYGFYKEEEYTNEMKAKSFIWHYQIGFEKMFLKMIGFEEE